MPIIDPTAGYLTVLNLFKTTTQDQVNTLVAEMTTIVDKADYPGWVSSTVHRAERGPGTANFIQWRGQEDLDSRYAGDEFKHRTVPVFHEITTYIRLMQTEVASAQANPDGLPEISPERGDYTVIEVHQVDPADQQMLIELLAEAHRWLVGVPGYRSQTVLRGIRSRGVQASSGDLTQPGRDGDFVVVYSQWDSPHAHDSFRAPETGLSAPMAGNLEQQRALVESTDWNSYRAVHTRSANPFDVAS